MRYPDFLKENGTIGFVAPSFGCAIEPYKSSFDNALKKFRADGYECKLGPNCYASDGIGISSTPMKCGEELTEGYCDRDSDVLISCGGGELMCEILDFVDFDRISQNDPKWYMGYSDNTNFTFTLTTMCDVASIYGPCAASFGTEPRHQSINDAFSLLTGEYMKADRSITLQGYDKWEIEQLKSEDNPLAGINATKDSYPLRFWPQNNKREADGESNVVNNQVDSISMGGRLLGGCLDCLVNLCGTKYDQVKAFNERYEEDGIIWFLEACDLNPLSIRRAMWELEHAGWFEKAAGFVIGRTLNYGAEMMGMDNYKAYIDVISHYQVPILMDADVGHLPPMLPLINGSMAHIESEGRKWSVQMKLV